MWQCIISGACHRAMTCLFDIYNSFKAITSHNGVTYLLAGMDASSLWFSVIIWFVLVCLAFVYSSLNVLKI